MIISNVIKKVLGWCLLVVFLIGITPKRFLHDVFSKHIDERFAHADVPYKSLSKYEYSCGFVNVEATTPFTAHVDFVEIIPSLFSGNPPIKNTAKPYLLPEAYTLLRGPPISFNN